ncbi:hypothetical protein SNE40_010034 [Patella caerulea]|uniref:Uncharacterized protein n=1 Tax=Patella caerulea TaxID=87958 RepID=A0AAN8PSF2_PATCE
MGCFHSKRLKGKLMNGESKKLRKSAKKYLPSHDTEDGGKGRAELKPEFTERQKELVVECWKCVSQDIARVGVVMFMKYLNFLIYYKNFVSYFNLCPH